MKRTFAIFLSLVLSLCAGLGSAPGTGAVSVRIEADSINSNGWENHGPIQASVNLVVIAPAAPAVIYAAPENGYLYKSSDGGASWEKAHLGYGPQTVRALAVDPLDEQTVYIGWMDHGLYKTTDGGQTWSDIGADLACPYILSLAIDPQTPQTVYAGTLCGMLRSRNGGDTWSEINTGLPLAFVYALVIDPLTPATLYAGIENKSEEPGSEQDCVFKSEDNGDHWVSISDGLPNYARAQALAIDPISPSTLYAGISGGGKGIYKSVNGGGDWQYINSQFVGVAALAVDPQNPQTIYAGMGEGVLSTMPKGVYKSTDGGYIWQDANLGLDSIVRGLAIDPLDPARVFAASAWDGIFFSQHGGA